MCAWPEREGRWLCGCALAGLICTLMCRWCLSAPSSHMPTSCWLQCVSACSPTKMREDRCAVCTAKKACKACKAGWTFDSKRKCTVRVPQRRGG